MCGICGFFGGGNREDIQRMTDALIHRGPDAGGIFVDGKLALGHRRLSIVDLSGGVQPMRDPQSGMVIVYNGEIYNHLPIRLELEKLGHIFETDHSDTETLLHAFRQWGTGCLTMFNGMFAFAIYDPHGKKIWLGRDRFGEKPLFYAINHYGFAFASEIGSLRLWPAFEHKYDEANIQRFFSWNYLSGSGTIYKDCHSLGPGSWLCFELESGRARRNVWWSFELDPDNSLTDRHESELVEELRRLLVQAVRRRLLSDVPLGIFLSGGIDSSAILAAATRCAESSSIRTFSIGFREKSFDESGKASRVAAFLKTRNDIEYLTEEEMRASIAPILSGMSEPFGDASLIPTAHLSRFARQHVKVALSGDGGDELFGGYDPLKAIMPGRVFQRLMPPWAISAFRSAMALLRSSDKNMSLEFKIRRFLRAMGYPEAMWIPIWMSGLEPGEIREFFSHPLDAARLYDDAVNLQKEYPHIGGLELALLFFTRIYLCDDILVKSDRASMMVSLEARAVFLDNDIVDFCRRLPTRFKYRKGQRKYILKKALEGWLPPEILRQPKKGFGIPLNSWLRSLPSVNPEVPGLKPGILERCRKAHDRRKGDFRYFLWDIQASARIFDDFTPCPTGC